MNELNLLQTLFAVDEDVAFELLQLCDMLAREDAIAAHGYPKDTPAGRDLRALVNDAAYVARLVELAAREDASAAARSALSVDRP